MACPRLVPHRVSCRGETCDRPPCKHGSRSAVRTGSLPSLQHQTCGIMLPPGPELAILPYKLTSMESTIGTEPREACLGTGKAIPLSLEDPVVPQLHDRLRARIVSCDLSPGQRISETEIAEAYQVSRQPVREAFIKLAEKKLVSIRPQRGTYIQRISLRAALTARFVREAIEVDLLRRMVDRITPEIIAELDAQIAQQTTAAQADDPAVFMQMDEAFHASLATYADAPSVSEYLSDLNVEMNRVRNISAREFSPQKLVTQHAAIVDGLRRRDIDAAEAALREHLREINNDLPRIIAAYPDYFESTEGLF
ncbi:MAG: GntR family transcriptional regulator [Pseudomonadota bacterium]